MNAQKKSAIGSKRLTGVCLAALAFTLPTSRAQGVGQSAYERGIDARAQSAARLSVPAQRRTHLIGEFVTRPTIVQAPAGTTIVAGSTAINAGSIVGTGKGATTAQLDVRCPASGGRVIMRANRSINTGSIVGLGDGASAAQVTTKCSHPLGGSVTAEDNDFINTGRIRANQ